MSLHTERHPHKGVSPVDGLYFLGLPWLSRRGSSFIWGCWQDARDLATRIAVRSRTRSGQPTDPPGAAAL